LFDGNTFYGKGKGIMKKFDYQARKSYYLGPEGYRARYYNAHKAEILRKARLYLKIGKVACILQKNGKLNNDILANLCGKVEL